MRVINNLRSFAALGLALTVVGLGYTQTVTQLAFWDFNDSNTIADGGVNASSASITLVGGTTSTFVSGSPLDTATTNRGLNTTTYAPQGQESGQRGIQFSVPTTAPNNQWYTNIRINFDIRWSNTSSRYVELQYTTDGTNWTTAATLEAPRPPGSTGGDIWWSSIQQPGKSENDFRYTFLVPNSVTDSGGFSDFAFRMVAVFDPATGQYTAARSTSTYSPNGTLRYDLVEIKGELVPEPASMVALGVGLAGLLGLRRRAKK